MTLFGRDNDSFIQWRFSSNNGLPGVPSNGGFMIEKRSGGDLLGHFWHRPELLSLSAALLIGASNRATRASAACIASS